MNTPDPFLLAAPSAFSQPDVMRAWLAAVVDSSDDAIVTKTLDGMITSWNAAAERLLGYAAREAVGMNILELLPADRKDEEKTIIAQLRAGKRIDHYETSRIAKGGRVIEVSLTISPIRDGNGAIVGASKILRDITDRRRTDRALAELLAERNELLRRERVARQEAERLSAAKDQFLALLSHELRTPLNAILGWTQLLRRQGRTEADVDKGLEVMERNVRLQGQLIDDLLDVTRIVSGRLRLDVQPLMPFGSIQNAVEAQRPVAAVKGVRLEAVLDPDAGPIRGDGARLQQVVWNLVGNAIKFTPAGGLVRVLLERVGSHIEVIVTDTGIGIAPAFLPYVFDRFRQADDSVTRKHGGLGLGLFIVKQIAEQHAGTVDATSEGEGKGATFRVRLPVIALRSNPTEQHPRVPSDAPPTATANLGGVKAIVVDDEPDAREVLARILANNGAAVRTAASANEALKLLREEWPDVLVSDIGMPENDGYDLLRQVRLLEQGRSARLPAIALTAFARSEDRTKAFLSGYLAHVAKPVEEAEILATVAALINRSS